MARPTKELTGQRDALIEQYEYIFKTLIDCGGGLYIQDLARVLNMAESTLMYQLKKCSNLQLVAIDKVQQNSTPKNIVRLSRIGWGKFGKNRGLCSFQEDTLDFFYYRAIYQKHFNKLDLKKEFIHEIKMIIERNSNKTNLKTLDRDRTIYSQKSVEDNLSILEKKNLFIKDYFIHPEMVRVDIHYINRKIDPQALAELMDLLTGAMEMCSFLIDDNYFQSKNKIKIDLEIISDSTVDKGKICKYIKKHKREYYCFTKEDTTKPNMYNVFNYTFKKRIVFHYIDKKNAEVIKY